MGQSGPEGAPPAVVSVRIVDESGAVLQQNPARLTIQPGQPFSIEAESASLRELFRTGLYQDLRAELTDVPGGVRLDFVVRQNYYVNQVRIAGVQEPPGDALALASLRLVLGQPFRESDMAEAIERLRETLRDEGLYQAEIGYELTPHPNTRQIDVVVNVTPGLRARIAGISIQNDTTFPGEELRRRLNLKAGQTITTSRLTRASERVRRWLADQEYFAARVTIRRQDYDPTNGTVQLEAIIHAGSQVRVVVEGASISSHTLRRLLPIYQEGAVDEDLLQEGRRALRDWLERDGYFDAQVNYSVSESASSPGSQPASLVTYEVTRGERMRLVNVAFSGNNYFSSTLLAGRLKISPASYASQGRYSSAMLRDDIASIKSLYDANGFHSAEVTSHTTENYLGHERDLSVQFDISEGAQTRISELTIEGNREISEDELLGVVGSSQGQPYSDFNVASDRANILALYYDRGFQEAQFTADASSEEQTDEGPRTRLTYQIAEGRQIMVSRVLLSGYEHTRPGVIAREVQIQAGDPLSESDVVETQRRLYNLGVFSRVAVAPQNPEGEDPQKTMVVLVDEARRYTLAYGGGFEAQRLGSGGSDAIGGTFRVSPRGTLEVTKMNLSGRADTLSFKVRASTIQGRALLAYTAPNYFGRPDFSLQITAFADSTRNVQTFSSKRYEASLQLAQRLSLTSSLLYRYSYRRVLASNLNITQEQIPLYNQPTRISELAVGWFRDRRNNPADATRGDFESIDLSMASKAIGSSANFVRLSLQNSTYHPLGRYLLFARSFRFGIQTPFGGTVSADIPLPERYFAGGGTSLRGFGLNQAGPRDPQTGFPIGGQALLVLNQELRFPLKLPVVGNRLGGAVFYDAGNVFSTVRQISFRSAPPTPVFDANDPGVCLTNCTNELNYFSHTTGVGLRYGTPIGPVALNLGYQLNPARILVPNPAGGLMLSRLPSFQFFINLGTTF